MSADIRLTLDSAFAKDLQSLADWFRAWDRQALAGLERSLKIVAQRWKAEAVKRVPVDTGNLKQRILTEVYKDSNGWTAACGTNVPYGKFLEFGTKWIAGGRVLKIGDDPVVTDDQAIKLWPAKNAGFIDPESGVANMPAVNAYFRNHANGNAVEEMPWLRTSLNFIKDWAIQMLADSHKPPERKVA